LKQGFFYFLAACPSGSDQ